MMTILLIVISILIILTLLEAAFYYLTHYPDGKVGTKKAEPFDPAFLQLK